MYQCKITPFNSRLKEKLLTILKTTFRNSIAMWFGNLNSVTIKTIISAANYHILCSFRLVIKVEEEDGIDFRLYYVKISQQI